MCETAFSFNGQMYEQIEGVSMGASLGPVVANIILTELENVIVNDLIESGKIKFYKRNVDDTLLLIRPEDIDSVLASFNSFDKNIQFTVDRFINTVPHFLDLEIHPDGITIYRKNTHTAQFTHFCSFTKWNHKVAWIRSLVYRALKICSPDKVTDEIFNIKKFASYNGFPKKVVQGIIDKTTSNENRDNHQELLDDDHIPLYINLPYLGLKSEHIAKNMKRKLYRCFKKEKKVRLNIIFKSHKIQFYTPTKDRIPFLSNSNVVYEFSCPGCGSSYVGETECTLFTRTTQHGWSQDDSAVLQHIHECNDINHIKNLFMIDIENFDHKSFQIEVVRNNTKIICKGQNRTNLLFKEALIIKERNPALNTGLKHSKKLNLF